jgi:uncharacterized protein (DUF736 family)
MSYEHKPGTGTVFPNDYKEKGDKKPDFTGKMNVNGEILEVGIWNSTTTDGKDYLFIKASEPFNK